jgi:hypothetical protein
MKFELWIQCDNAAFSDSSMFDEVARLMDVAAKRIASGTRSGALLDTNGNSVGRFDFSTGEHPQLRR